MNFAGIQSRAQSQKLYSASAANVSASFNIIGNSYAYSITLPVTDILLTKKGNDEAITIGSFNITSTKSGLNVDEQLIVLGAMLNVNAFQAEGIYTSKTPLTVIVNYN